MVGEKKPSLPPRDSAQFKTLLKFYTQKMYKKGLKAADSILKNHPNHGETLAMKGLLYNGMEKKEEAYENVRKGLKNDLTSHVCWHAYGLLHRSDRNYTEAIKCYINALKHDKENLQILRDLSLLQIQMRDLSGYVETRRQLLTLKNQKNNWIALALAYHLVGNYKRALVVMDGYESTVEAEERPDFGHSELLLYKNQILEESGDLNGALSHLQHIESQVLDKLCIKEKRASLLLALSRYPEAAQAYRNLVRINTENHHYHNGLVASTLSSPHYPAASQTPSQEQLQSLTTLYEELAKEYPKSLAIRRIPLDFLHDEPFQKAFEAYIRPDLRKGVPSLFIGLKQLYGDEKKRVLIDSLVKANLDSLLTKNTFSDSTEPEPPTSLLWMLYFGAQHYDRMGNTKEALELIEKAVAHTPTVIELYTLKAKVLKHAGDYVGAWKIYDKAREMDLADRYLNTKATLYALRADQVKAALDTITLFIKEGANSQDIIFEMQYMWYENESGASHLRTGKYGLALKRFKAVEKHFGDILEDQFDFHTYCLRKMTLRAYISLLRLEDQLYGLPYYLRAAKGIIRSYIAIIEKPNPLIPPAPEVNETAANEEKKQQQPPVSAKKQKKEAKKQQKEKEKEEKERQKEKKVEDTDPEGNQLAAVADPLGEASKYVATLLKYRPNDVEGLSLASKVYTMRKKFLLAIRSIHQLAKLVPQSEEVHQRKVELHLALTSFLSDSSTASLSHPTVIELLKEQHETILSGLTPTKANDDFLSSHSSSLSHLKVALELMIKIDGKRKEEAAGFVEKVDWSSVKGRDNLQVCIEFYAFVRDTFGEELAGKVKNHCHGLFPLASVFAPPPPPPPSDNAGESGAGESNNNNAATSDATL